MPTQRDELTAELAITLGEKRGRDPKAYIDGFTGGFALGAKIKNLEIRGDSEEEITNYLRGLIEGVRYDGGPADNLGPDAAPDPTDPELN